MIKSLKIVLIAVLFTNVCVCNAKQPSVFGNFGIASGDPIPSRPGMNFKYSGKPGDHIEDIVRLINYDSVKHSFNIKAGTAHITNNNSLNCNTDSNDSWIKLAKNSIDVISNSTTSIPLIIDIPSESLPGEHNFCLEVTYDDDQSNDSEGVKLVPKIINRAVVSIEGDYNWLLSLNSKPRITYKNNRPELELELSNTGDVSLKSTISLKSTGLSKLSQTNTENFILPGSIIKTSVDGLPRSFWGGLYSLKININYLPALDSSGTSELTAKSIVTDLKYIVWPSIWAWLVYIICISSLLITVKRIINSKNRPSYSLGRSK